MGKIVGLTFPEMAGTGAVERLVCPHCGKEYKSQEALTKHIKDKHSETAGSQE